MKILTTLMLLAFISTELKLPKEFKKQFSFVPSGMVEVGNETLSVQAFYMQNYEVTNKEYNQFLKWLKENGTKEQQELAKTQNKNWKNEFDNDFLPFSKEYHINPAYENYPVVNITHEGAKLYCQYLESQINKNLKSGSVKVRLPKHAEFIRAGAGDSLGAIYSWQDYYVRNPDGNFRANFTRIPQAGLTKDKNGNLISKPVLNKSNKGENYDLTAPSKSYWASDLGFYNLNGNVAEMIDEKGIAVGGSWLDLGYDIRLQSRKNYDKASCEVGFRPVFSVVE